MQSIWDAPSDRDYYGCEDSETEEICIHCAANESQAHEQWCPMSRPARESENHAGGLTPPVPLEKPKTP